LVRVTDRTWEDWTLTWAAARPESSLLHLDSAAVGRSSRATLDAVAAHARLEAEVGGYVAQERVSGQLDATRADVAVLLGSDADGVAFVESASAAFDALLGAWPLSPGDRVGVAASEWGPNLETFAHRGLVPVTLTVDSAGVLDLEALEKQLVGDPPDLVHLDLVAAQRGLVQPVAEVLSLGRAHGVPVWVDAAQAVGHVAVPAGAAAVYATSRKWLTGPRGVGMLAVAPEHRSTLRLRRLAKHPDLPDVQHLESDEAHVAGRVGLGVAVREHLSLDPERVHARLRDIGRRVREGVASLSGWEVVHPEAPAASTTALVPTAGQDVGAVRQRLLTEHGVLTSVCLPWRAPLEMGTTGPTRAYLRLSPHVDLTEGSLERVCQALAAV
jgi:pyridoxal 5-phosphate dependent beta-lyase